MSFDHFSSRKILYVVNIFPPHPVDMHKNDPSLYQHYLSAIARHKTAIEWRQVCACGVCLLVPQHHSHWSNALSTAHHVKAPLFAFCNYAPYLHTNTTPPQNRASLPPHLESIFASTDHCIYGASIQNMFFLLQLLTFKLQVASRDVLLYLKTAR